MLVLGQYQILFQEGVNMSDFVTVDDLFADEVFVQGLDSTRKEGTAQKNVNQFMREYITASFKIGRTVFTKKHLTDTAKAGKIYRTKDGKQVHLSSDNINKAIEDINKDSSFPYRIDKNGKNAINGYKIVDKKAEQEELERIKQEKEAAEKAKQEEKEKKEQAKKQAAEKAKKAKEAAEKKKAATAKK